MSVPCGMIRLCVPLECRCGTGCWPSWPAWVPGPLMRWPCWARSGTWPGFIDRAQGELARLTGVLDAAAAPPRPGIPPPRRSCGMAAAARRAGPGNWSRPGGPAAAGGDREALTAGEISLIPRTRSAARPARRRRGRRGGGGTAARLRPPPAATRRRKTRRAGPGARRRAWTRPSCAAWVRNWCTGPTLWGGGTAAETVRAPAPVARVHLRPVRRDLRDVRGRGIAGDHPHRGRRVRPARRDRGHPHRRAAADGRPDRRLPGRPGRRQRRHPARRRPAPEHPGRRTALAQAPGAPPPRPGTGHCSPPARSSRWPAAPTCPSSAGATASRWTSAAATAPKPPPCAARWKPATRAAAPPAAASRPPGAPPTT